VEPLTGWGIALFDAGRTLIQQHPGLAETILAWADRGGLGLSAELAARAAASSLAWADETSLACLRGEAPLAHDQFLLGFYLAGLRAALPELDSAEARRRALALYRFSEGERLWIALPGARETLELLRSRGRRVGLVSNFSPSLRGILAAQGMLGLLDPVVISGEVGIEKPDPRILLIACDRAGVSPNRAVYVGDQPLDVVCARRAGMPVVWVADPDRDMPPFLDAEPDRRAASIADVPALLGIS
jgi:HAD superfamily hydrolase (TIGR01549 family)